MTIDWRINRVLYKLPNRPFAKTAKDNRMARLVDLNALIEDINEILEDIENTVGSGSGGPVCDITMTPQTPAVLGPATNFTRTDFGSEVDIIVPGVVEITRGDSGSAIYNSATELSYAFGVSPADTEWNSSFTDAVNNGHSNLDTLPSRIYTDFRTALNGSVGNNILSTPLVMHIISTDQYFLFTFTQWTSGGNGGGFAYTREEVTALPGPLCVLTFSDGTILNTSPGYIDAGTNITIDTTVDLQGNVTKVINADVAIPVGRSVYVDSTYGNDGTAEKYNFVKPYQTLDAAMAVAFSSDTIIVRPGSYGILTLQSSKKLHFMRGATINQLSDGGVRVTNTVITGFGTIDRGFNNTAVSLTGIGTDISTDFDEVICAGTYFEMGQVGGKMTWRGRFRKLQGCRFNGFFYRPRGVVDIEIEVTEIIQSGGTFGNTANPLAPVFIVETETDSRIKIKAKHLHLVNGSDCGSLYVGYGTDISHTYFDLERFTNLYTGVRASDGANIGGCILKRGNHSLTVDIEEEVYIDNMYFARCVSGTGVLNLNNLNVVCDKRTPLVIDNIGGGHTINANNSTFKRLSNGDDENSVLSVTVNGKANLSNCRLIKESAGGNTDSVVYVNNAVQKTFLKNTEILLVGTTGLACDSTSIPNGEIYFRNTVSNFDNGVNITDIAVVPGFTPNDLALEI